MTTLYKSYGGNDKASELIKQLFLDAQAHSGFQFQNGVLSFITD
uniref:Uncharacterized protein n=1 Tax=Manihot esculenta TaxID=3983 RepID=A0A2C9UI91_MANES